MAVAVTMSNKYPQVFSQEISLKCQGNGTTNSNRQPYGICQMRWENIDILDYALLAHLSDTTSNDTANR